MTTLHVTNGDSAVEALREAGIQGDYLPWRDVLHDGPVPEGLSVQDLAATRARFIDGAGWSDPDGTLRAFRQRDRDLIGSRASRIVLWFEHDLYDQLQLIQILDRMQDATVPVELVCEERFVAEQSTDDLSAMYERRVPVTPLHVEDATDAWLAFRAPEPTELTRVARRPSAALPFLAPALRRQLEEYPDIRSGLSRSERQILECVSVASRAGRPPTAGALFRLTQELEAARFMGDWSFWRRLAELARGPRPLIELSTGPAVPVPDREAFTATVSVTANGRSVEAREADRVDLLGLDHWIGGVHLLADDHWRWNPDSERLTRCTT